MTDERVSVFLSYRRKDTSGYAGWLDYSLGKEYEHADVFRDVEGIEGGSRFHDVIEKAIKHCDAFLCLIGPKWTTLTSEGESQPRLHEPDDLVRQELETALRLKRRVVPILVQGASMPSKRELPEALHELAERHAVRLGDESWGTDLKKLSDVLDGIREVKVAGKAMTGQAIYNRVTKGGGAHFWVGRNGGLKGSALKKDIETGRWKDQSYQVQFGRVDPGKNWFAATDFVELVGEPTHANSPSADG